MRNALFYVAKDSGSEDRDKILGVSCWMPPRPVELRETWGEWTESWKLWMQQVGMNLYYGRGGLNIKVRLSCPIRYVSSYRDAHCCARNAFLRCRCVIETMTANCLSSFSVENANAWFEEGLLTCCDVILETC